MHLKHELENTLVDTELSWRGFSGKIKLAQHAYEEGHHIGCIWSQDYADFN